MKPGKEPSSHRSGAARQNLWTTLFCIPQKPLPPVGLRPKCLPDQICCTQKSRKIVSWRVLLLLSRPGENWQLVLSCAAMRRGRCVRAVRSSEMSGRRLNYKVPFLVAVQVSPLNSAQARQISILTCGPWLSFAWFPPSHKSPPLRRACAERQKYQPLRRNTQDHISSRPNIDQRLRVSVHWFAGVLQSLCSPS